MKDLPVEDEDHRNEETCSRKYVRRCCADIQRQIQVNTRGGEIERNENCGAEIAIGGSAECAAGDEQKLRIAPIAIRRKRQKPTEQPWQRPQCGNGNAAVNEVCGCHS